jgi:hypothetical protein
MAAKHNNICPAGLGFRAHIGWAAAVAVIEDHGAPQLVHSSIVQTGERGDRVSMEPYHVAAGIDKLARGGRPPNPEAIIAQGRKLQDEMATKSISRIISELAGNNMNVVAGAILTTRSWLGHSLEGILGDHAHVRIYEGEAVRAAIRSGLTGNGIAVVGCDERSMLQVTAESNGWSELEIQDVLAAMGKQAGRPWRQDQKLAALAAWAALKR